MRHSKKLSLDAKGEGSLLHVKDNEEFVRHNKCLVGGQVARISFARLVFAGEQNVLLF